MKKKAPAKPAKQKLVYQFRVSLDESKPAIWRRIQLSEASTFWELHVAIQDSMGWMDCHLHEFELEQAKGGRLRIGVPSEEVEDDVQPGWKVSVADHLSRPGDTVSYLYDFGDDWRHTILLEGILLEEAKVEYPVCLDGKRACPPEDCGGVFGYENLLEALADEDHPDHEELTEWMAENVESAKAFDPEAFNPAKIKFGNPAKRLKLATGGK
ncbi:plasmid pRiA4b ORF-3 family protein [Verrucomicrobium sp. BvORR106]|uniref:plasmid pRiA4b ORF-3 family protein n=1 Tax=Verrucomicrobium sp. BvORR106 TaxID=1403819 RepID=UPI0007C7E971|nr:plasmid pRiA4b ORF-3 family protein [Verrucomicrobium sp. BvORR106]